MVDKLVADFLLGLCGALAKFRHPVNDVETIEVVYQTHVERCGRCYKAFAFRDACRDHGPLTYEQYAQTNGNAERVIQTALREWAYAHPVRIQIAEPTSRPHWLYRHNWHRPHSEITSQTPVSRLPLTMICLLRLHN